MFNPDRLPPPLVLGPFTVTEARALGLTDGQLRHARIRRLGRGIRTLAEADDDGTPLALLARPYSLATGYSAVSHETAFHIWGFPGFLPSTGSGIHIARQSPHTTPRRPGVVGHKTQFFDDEVAFVDGLWITTRVRTWLDCSRRMSEDELTVVADHLLRVPRPKFEGRSEPYASISDLDLILDRHKGTPGIRKARLALGQARVGSDSAPETRLRLALARARLPEADLNTPVDLGNGVERSPDLSFPVYKVAVEYEGRVHADPAQVDRDISREEDYQRGGWQQVRISNRHMDHEAHAAVAKVRAALRRAGWRPTG
ncbi:hypothetical protein [Arthrobacter sp. 35W]|uniref:hypothetical protein n=1 Tax=Arthrobacter sp. 35W TaxID=1132441 RepID=UPI00047DC43E|nr:hypothetical protein [Arthrobacter sp. 35W]